MTIDRAFLAIVLIAATISDLKNRQVPLWLTGAALAGGLVDAAFNASLGLQGGLLGLAAAVIPPMPFFLLGGLGGADILLLASIGIWEGWRFVLLTEWWTAMAGLVLALVAYRRNQRAFAYVPAVLIGAAVASWMI